MKKTDPQDKKPNKITSKQVVAFGGIILLALMYFVTLIVAIVDTSASGKLFALCLLATMAVPLLIWIYTWIYGRVTDKKAIGDPDIPPSDPSKRA